MDYTFQYNNEIYTNTVKLVALSALVIVSKQTINGRICSENIVLTEPVVWKCFLRKVFLKISQHLGWIPFFRL